MTDGIHLRSITIGGFRGFSADATLELAVPDGAPGSGLTVLVGPNNAGKSSILEAIKPAGNTNQPEIGRGVRNVPYGDLTSIRYTLSNGATVELRSVEPGSYLTKWEPAGPPLPNRVYTVPPRRSIQSHFGRSVWSRGDYTSQSTILPADRNENPSLNSRLMQVVEDRNAKQTFDEHVCRLLGQDLKWELDRLESGQYVFAIEGATGSHTSDGLGFGILRVFYIVAGLFDVTAGTVICIDEPELSMHPQIQRRVAEYLAEHSAHVQIIVSTHSPYFVDPTWFAAGTELARCYVRDGSTRIKQLSPGTKIAMQRLVTDLNNPHVLGLDAREIYFAEEGVLVVEGQEDVIMLRRVAAALGAAMPRTFFGWGAGGAEKVRVVLAILDDLGFSSVSSLLDGDKATTSERLKEQFPTYRHLLLPADDIRDKPQQSRPAKAGVCTDAGVLKDEYRERMAALLEEIAAQ